MADTKYLNFNSAETLNKYIDKLKSEHNPLKKIITLCGETGCIALGAKSLEQTFKDEIKKQKLEEKVELKITGCQGFCERGPVVILKPEDISSPAKNLGKK